MHYRNFQYIISQTVKFYHLNSRRNLLLLTFFAISSFLLGLLVILYVSSNTEQENFLPQTEEIESPLVELPTRRPLKQHYDQYLRMDYRTNQAVCKPSSTFNTNTTIASMQILTNSKLNKLFNGHLAINIDIISVNPIVKKSYKTKQKSAKRLVCDYVLELYIGLEFPAYCDVSCQSKEIQHLTSNVQPFGNPVDESFVFFLYSFEFLDENNEFHIDQIYLYRSSKYYNKSVYIRSIYEDFYVTALVLDPDSHQTSIIMDKNDRSLFLMKDGLHQDPSEKDSSTVFISLLTDKNYLRHANGRITLEKNDQSDLFKRDATFRLRHGRHLVNTVVFQPINTPHLCIAVDSVTNRSLILEKPEDEHRIIDYFNRRFLFQLDFNV